MSEIKQEDVRPTKVAFTMFCAGRVPAKDGDPEETVPCSSKSFEDLPDRRTGDRAQMVMACTECKSVMVHASGGVLSRGGINWRVIPQKLEEYLEYLDAVDMSRPEDSGGR